MQCKKTQGRGRTHRNHVISVYRNATLEVKMTARPHEAEVQCGDFSFFQDVLKKMRTIDDGIVHALNTSIPTTSFAKQVDATNQCKSLYEQLLKARADRNDAIKKCVEEASAVVKQYKAQKDAEPDRVDLLIQLRKEQTRLRLIQSELNVEEVIKGRSDKIFHERCRLHYNPPESS